MSKRLTADERRAAFWARVERCERGCWVWRGSYTPAGYGRFLSYGRHEMAHRVAYEYSKGPIPEGLQIDHLCRNRACVNPDHLEAVTQRENLLRGEGVGGKHARTTHCPRGHAYTPDNTYFSVSANGTRWRRCRVCHLEHSARQYERRKRERAATH